MNLGPARSGKTWHRIQEYKEALNQRRDEQSPAGVLWLAPNSRAANAVRSDLLLSGVEACIEPGISTFHNLAKSVLSLTRPIPRALRPAVQRELLRRLVNQALRQGHLHYFAEAAKRANFIDALAEHFHELERADIGAEEYAKFPPAHKNEQENRESALLYQSYASSLAEHHLLSEEGSLRILRDRLLAGDDSLPKQFELVVVDGFTDFTRTQHRILEVLATRTRRLHITLPCDTTRPDLFAKTTTTLAELRYVHPKIHLEEPAAESRAWPALKFALENLFRNPKQIPKPKKEVATSLDRLQFIAGASTHDEVVQIARRIKGQLASGGAKPGDILVVFRSLNDASSRIREVFTQYGIPFSLDAPPRLLASPIIKAVLNLLRLDQEDWPFRRLVAIVTNNLFSCFDHAARRAADWLVRELQIVDGRDRLLDLVRKFASDDTPTRQQSEQRSRLVEAAKLALPLLEHLEQSLAALPTSSSPNGWFAAILQLASQLGLPGTLLAPAKSRKPTKTATRGSASHNSNSYDTEARAVWLALQTHFAALERLDDWTKSSRRSLDRSEFMGTLVDLASHESLPQSRDDVGRVRVVSAPAVRTMTARHLYLAGMSEQSFPAVERSGKLATDADYRSIVRKTEKAWAEAAKMGPPTPTRAQSEMLLFYEVLSRAEETLTISYPALDDKAQELPPSPYVLEIERVFGESLAPRLRPAPPQLSPVPRDGRVCSPSEARIYAIARAIDREPDRRPLAGIFASQSQPLAGSIEAGLRITYDRAHGESFGASEGMLLGPAALKRLAQRFGSRHFWSPSQWETYAACPYKFFLEDVLKLAPLGDLVLETDHSRRGSRLHNVLAAFHRQWPEFREPSPFDTEDESVRFLEHLLRVVDEKIAKATEGGIESALLELDRRQIQKWARKHFDHNVKYDALWNKRGASLQPTHLEYRFGPSRVGDEEHDPESASTAFELNINGEKIRITGQIDRIDVGTLNGQKVFNVIDYKSGKKPSLRSDEIATGERIQLPLYVEAAQALLFKGDATPIAAGYWSMAGGFDAKGALAVEVAGEPAERWGELRGTVEQRVGEFVQDIRSGVFPVDSRDDKCTSYCEFNTVCRIAQVRAIGKTQSAATESPQPPAPNP